MKKHVQYGEVGFSGGSDSKESACNVGGLGLIPELCKSPGEGNPWREEPGGLQPVGSQRVGWATKLSKTQYGET